ncbi:unnamed protein product [Urochloa humidicola]
MTSRPGPAKSGSAGAGAARGLLRAWWEGARLGRWGASRAAGAEEEQGAEEELAGTAGVTSPSSTPASPPPRHFSLSLRGGWRMRRSQRGRGLGVTRCSGDEDGGEAASRRGRGGAGASGVVED